MARALLVIDVQNDFTEGGALGVEGGAAVAASVTELLRSDPGYYDVVIASRDWHDADNNNGGHFADGAPDFVNTWPPHCVAGTHGADYHPALDASLITVHITKGQGKPAYSIFEGVTADGLDITAVLNTLDITDIDVVGIATDYCVRASALDALAAPDAHGNRHRVRVLADLVAGVAPSTSVAALAELEDAGIAVVPSPLSTASTANTASTVTESDASHE
jgi:nicotinamidase-related amidase